MSWANIVPAVISAAGQLGSAYINKKAQPKGDSFLKRVRDAKKVGIHPLAAIGASSFHEPFNQTGADLALTADHLAGGLRDVFAAQQRKRQEAAEVDQRKRDQVLQEKEATLIDAQIAESRSRTLLNAANAKRVAYPDRPLINGTNGGIETLDGRPLVKEPARNIPARQKVQLGKHEAIGPSPEAFEVGLSELIAGGLIYLPQWMWAESELSKPPKKTADQKEFERHSPASP